MVVPAKPIEAETPPTQATDHWSAADLRWVIDAALERGAHLLTAGELSTVRALGQLSDPALDVFARLSARRDAFQRIEAAGDALDELESVGMVSRFVPWSIRAQHSTVAELKAGAKRLGLPRSGNRAALVERMQPHRAWSEQPWIRVRHRRLVRRLEQWAFLRAWPERSTLVVERLGHVRWPDYAPTQGSSLFPHRAGLLAWEALLHAKEPEDRLEGLEAGLHEGPGRLDLGRRSARHVLDEARAIERSGDLARAAGLYARLAAVSPRYATRALIRLARTLEASGTPEAALDTLIEHRPHARGGDRLALNRAGRRLARSLRRGWAPDRPLKRVPERTLRLGGFEAPEPRPGARPLWRDGRTIEAAVVALLAEQGRTALHVEGGLWRTLFALLFASDCYFLPVPGQLPVRRLSGPLDLGTPRFAERRREAVASVRGRIRAGEAPEVVSETYERFEGTRLAGCSWETEATHRELAHTIGPDLLLGVLDPLLELGFGSASGLPDLLVLPGPPFVLPRGIPASVGESLCLVEIKGPTDSLSDAQRTWLDRLAPFAAAEVWKVRVAG